MHERVFNRHLPGSSQQVYLKDLESSNGTYLNGERVTKPTELQDGMTIDFGVVVYDEDGETVKHDKVSAIIRLVERDLEMEILPDVSSTMPDLCN